MTRPRLVVCLLVIGMALLLAAPAGAHLGNGTSGAKIVQTSRIVSIHYHLAGDLTLAGLPPAVASVDYIGLASESGHGTMSASGSLGGLVLLQDTENVNRPLWSHTECAPMDGPVIHVFTLTLKAAGGLASFPFSSPPDPRTASGTYTVDWPLVSSISGIKVGHARIVYQLTLQSLPEISLCGPH